MLRKMIMPTLGLDMEGAVIQKWLRAEGDRVAKDEPVVVVETDKATTELTSPAKGLLKQILHGEGTAVPVTQTIALIEADEPEEVYEVAPIQPDGRSEVPVQPDGQEAGADQPKMEQSAPTTTMPAVERRAIRASPAARRVARELGVDLAEVRGTGPGGRIQSDDVRAFAAQRGTPTADAPAGGAAGAPGPTIVEAGLPGRLVPLGRKRRITAQRMSLSARTVARLTMNMEVDAGEMVRLRSRLLPAYEPQGIRLSYNDILVKVVATALVEHPYLNARWTEQGIFLVEPINVGVAVAVEDGLVVPVLHDADRKTLPEISSELARLVGRAREDRLSLEEITGGTFTITNLGMFGVDSFTPIVNPPEAAILGVGRMVEKPVGIDGQMVLRTVMTLSLSFDHRIVDGAPAARFLQRVKQLLEEPYLLL